jgi:hypothetical protein
MEVGTGVCGRGMDVDGCKRGTGVNGDRRNTAVNGRSKSKASDKILWSGCGSEEGVVPQSRGRSRARRVDFAVCLDFDGLCIIASLCSSY